MLLRDIKKGEVYAYIPGYGEMTRKQNNGMYCGNLPSAVAVEVVDKEKRLVEVRRDTCGRPKMENRTFLVCNVINIAPTDPMADELDIVKDKHKDIVIFDTEDIKTGDLIWPWQMEIKQARENANILHQVENRIAYVNGLARRMALVLWNQDRGFADQVAKRYAKILDKEGVDKLRSFEIEYYSATHYLKQDVYDFLRGLDEGRVPRLDTDVRAAVTFGGGNRWQDDAALNLLHKRAAKVSSAGWYRFYGEALPEEYAAYDKASKQAMEDRKAYNKSNNDSDKLYDAYQRSAQAKEDAENVFRAAICALTAEQKLRAVDLMLKDLGKQASEKVGQKIAIFDPKKSWAKWAEELEGDVREAKGLPRVKK